MNGSTLMDFAILDAIQEHLRSPFLDAVMPFVTHLGDLGIVWLVTAAVLVAQPKRRVYGIAVVVALLLTVVVGSLVLKPLVGRMRPYDVVGGFPLLIPPPTGDSFPSNHSMASFAAATVICLLPRAGRGVTAAKIGAIVVATLIAFSRLYLYVHFPSDILVGAVLGVALGFAAVALAKRFMPQPKPPAGGAVHP
ncbi:phosphatase PAP2 family protein [Gordonibacter sp.]|uniref:phosphatase PAP2 family protein n=1 Tax=Gordonibacter sp. TaxID=1968902 RepID=UPI002FCAAB76